MWLQKVVYRVSNSQLLCVFICLHSAMPRANQTKPTNQRTWVFNFGGSPLTKVPPCKGSVQLGARLPSTLLTCLCTIITYITTVKGQTEYKNWYTCPDFSISNLYWNNSIPLCLLLHPYLPATLLILPVNLPYSCAVWLYTSQNKMVRTFPSMPY